MVSASRFEDAVNMTDDRTAPTERIDTASDHGGHARKLLIGGIVVLSPGALVMLAYGFEWIVVVAPFTAIEITVVLGIKNRHPFAIVAALLSPVAFVALVWLGPWYQCIQSGPFCPTTRALVQGFIGATLLGVGALAVAAVPPGAFDDVEKRIDSVIEEGFRD
jgi:hypothetical protein